METFFLFTQAFFAIGGAFMVLFVRQPQRAVFGFLFVFLAVASMMVVKESPWLLCLLCCLGFGTVTPWIYLKEAKRFDRGANQPLDTHLGVSRILLLLISAYFLLSVLPLWPYLLSDIQKNAAPTELNISWMWAGYLSAVFVLVLAGLLPFLQSTRNPS